MGDSGALGIGLSDTGTSANMTLLLAGIGSALTAVSQIGTVPCKPVSAA